MTTFGMEEEYIFLDPVTLSPLALVEDVVAGLGIGPDEAERVQHEFLACQLERSTAVCRDLDEAEEELLGFRRRVATVAADLGGLVAATGFAPGSLPPAVVSSGDRYRSIRTTSRGLVDEHFVDGLHVHVGIPSRAAGLEAMNRIRVWMPALVALAANSPVHLLGDSGFASWRTLHFQRWTTHGCPPAYLDLADHDARLDRLVGIGGSIDRAVMSFNIRLSTVHPTLEIRAADVQLEARDSVVLAAIIRALVSTALDDAELGLPPVHLAPELLDAALWHAARDGLSDGLVDPVRGIVSPAATVVTRMMDSIETALLREGDSQVVHEGVARCFAGETGASRQRRTLLDGGPDALGTLLRTSFIAGTSERTRPAPPTGNSLTTGIPETTGTPGAHVLL